MSKTATVILAAGKGKRMKSELPKVMHKAAGKSLLEYVADASFKKNHLNICVTSKDNRDLLKQVLPKQTLLAIQKEQKGTADAVKAALPLLKKNKINDVVVLPGDMPLIKKNTISKLLRIHYKAENKVTLLTGNLKDPSGYGRIIRNNKKQVCRITEHKDLASTQRDIDEINTGIYVFSVSFLAECLKKIKANNAQKEFYLTDCIEIAVKSAPESAGAVKLGFSNECFGVNSREDLAAAGKMIYLEKNKDLMAKGVTIEAPETVFIDAQVKIGKDTVIHPYSIISGDVKIGQNCEIGPFAHIREGVIVGDQSCIGNFVEVKKSRIGKNTKAKHLSYLGNAEIGNKVNIGAGSITANYDGFNKHITKIADNTRIGSNTVIVAPSDIGSGVVTGAGSVVTGRSKVRNNAVIYGVPARERKGT